MAIPVEALRRHVVAWQGYAGRHICAPNSEIIECVRRLSCVQLDAISTVERSHILVFAARVGATESGAISRLLASGRLFEYWAHETCLLPMEDWSLFRRRMRERRMHHWWGPVIESDPKLAANVLAQIRERGPLGSRDFEGKGGGGMWRLKPAKRMLDALWTAGELVVCSRRGSQRVYDLPERVLLPSVLAAPMPSKRETLRALIIRAVYARGALTAKGIVDHYRIGGGTKAIGPHIAALCRTGKLKELAVRDDGPPVYVPPEADPAATEAPKGAVLLSPFDNLLWDRSFTRRIFGFDHVVEVYKPKCDRIYGYYVLPLLIGSRLVGRADLKACREEGVLRVKAFHLAPHERKTAALSAHFECAVCRLARTIGLASVGGIVS